MYLGKLTFAGTNSYASTSQREVYRENHFHGDRCPVQKCRLVFPLLNGIEGRRHQKRHSRHHFHLRDVSVVINHAVDPDIPLDVGLSGQGWVNRLDHLNQARLLHAAADLIGTNVCSVSRWRWRRGDFAHTSEDSAEHSSDLSSWNPSRDATRHTTERLLGLCCFLFNLCDPLRNESWRKQLVLMEETLRMRMNHLRGRRWRGWRRRRCY